MRRNLGLGLGVDAALHPGLAAAHRQRALRIQALKQDHPAVADGDVIEGAVGAADIVQEAPAGAFQRPEGGFGQAPRPGGAESGLPTGLRRACGGPDERDPGAGAGAGEQAGQPGHVIAVEHEHDDPDEHHDERDERANERRGRRARGSPSQIVSLG